MAVVQQPPNQPRVEFGSGFECRRAAAEEPFFSTLLVPGLAHTVVAPKQSVPERVRVEGKPSIEVRHPDGHIIHGVERHGTH